MPNEPKASGTLSPLFAEEERFLLLTPTELRVASGALALTQALAYDADGLPVVESNALLSAHFKVKEALADRPAHHRIADAIAEYS